MQQEQEKNYSKLYYAINAKDLNKIKELIHSGLDINSFGKINYTHPMLIALRTNNLAIISFLCSKTILTNQTLKPLLQAITFSASLEVIKFFFKIASNEEKISALYIAIMENKNLEIIKFLIENGVNPNRLSNQALRELLEKVILEGNLDFFNFLLQKEVNINVQDNIGRTILHFVLKNNFKNNERRTLFKERKFKLLTIEKGKCN